ncbi:hypothetical protein CspHIS471_0408170 [Cutaneotrichosporon sp. HIS471]|nr:hypothetical protein CspHIS471_0408170 [Cutaneotrichosporon sp. HIS471]
MRTVQDENACSLRSSKPSKASTTRRPLGDNVPPSAPDKPTNKAPKPVRQRSVLAPIDNVSERANVARLPRLKSSSSSSTPSERSKELRAKTKTGTGTELRIKSERIKTELRAKRPTSPRTPPRQIVPKTPAEQIGRAGAVRAALLNKRRPIVVPDPPPKRPRVQKSINVRADEVSAASSAIDRPYEPSPKRSAKADAMVRRMFGDEMEPPSPPCAFGGDDFKFDFV